MHQDELTAGPLHVHNQIESVLGVMGLDCSEVLGAVLTLASAALESARETEDLRTENIIMKAQTAVDASGIVGDSAA